MGMPSVPQLLIILVIVVLIFGAKRLRNLGGDLGSAVKGFKQAVKDGDEDKDKDDTDDKSTAQARIADEGAQDDATLVREADETKKSA